MTDKTDIKSKYITLPKRPFDYLGRVLDYKTSCGSLFLSVSTDDAGNPAEVFIVRGNSGGCAQAFSEALGKMVSVALRSGFDPAEIIKLFTQIRCDGGSWQDGKRVTSCLGAIALALQYVLDKRKTMVAPEQADVAEDSPEEVEARLKALADERIKQGGI